MTRSLSRMQAAVLGFVVLAGLALAGWALFHMGDRQRLWADTIELRAGFSSANGIDRGTPVRIRGVEAGQVVAIDLPAEDNPEGKVFLRLRIDRKYLPVLGFDPRARILNEGMLGGRVVNLDPGKDKTRRLAHNDEIAVVEAQDLTDLMSQAGKTLQEIRDSNGSLAKLLKSDEAHKEVVTLVKDTQALVKQGQETFRQTQDAIRSGQDALTSVKQDADAIKKLPILRNYVEDHQALLFRPECERDRRVFNVVHLFEPNTAVLTDDGKRHLINLTAWLEGLKVKASDVVIVTFADPAASSEYSQDVLQRLTQKQSETVASFLKENVRAHKMGWFTSRKVTPIGVGASAPPVPEKEALPPSRTEIQIFWPR